MHDPFVMGELQGFTDLRHDLECLRRLEMAVANQVPVIAEGPADFL